MTETARHCCLFSTVAFCAFADNVWHLRLRFFLRLSYCLYDICKYAAHRNGCFILRCPHVLRRSFPYNVGKQDNQTILDGLYGRGKSRPRHNTVLRPCLETSHFHAWHTLYYYGTAVPKNKPRCNGPVLLCRVSCGCIVQRGTIRFHTFLLVACQ